MEVRLTVTTAHAAEPEERSEPSRTSPNGTALLHLGPTPTGPRRDQLTHFTTTCHAGNPEAGAHYLDP